MSEELAQTNEQDIKALSFLNTVSLKNIFKLLKAECGVCGLVNFLFTAEDVGHLVGGRAHIALVEIALFVQHLRMAQHNLAAPRPGKADFHIAGHILTKIKHSFTP